MTTPPSWDVRDPAFLATVFYVMAGLAVVVMAVGILLAPARWSGLVTGAVLALLLYLTALQAGRIFLRTQRFALVMLWLMGSQVVLWLGMAVLLGIVKVDPMGFALGASVLPGAVIITVLLWMIYHKGTDI